MNTYANKKGFTIAELVVALLLISCIAMILMPIVFNDSKKQVLMTALNKNYNTLLEIHQTIPMLQARGKIPPGSINTTTFMQAVVLTQKTIGTASNGNALANNNKFSQYIAGYANKTTPSGLLTYDQFALNNINITNNTDNTIILKNGVFISVIPVNNGGVNTNYIMVDINGSKTPNTTGEDIFFFEINNATGNSVFQPVNDDNCQRGQAFATSAGCARRYIEAGKME